MKTDFILKNIHLVDPVNGIHNPTPAELWIEDGKVAGISKSKEFSSQKTDLKQIDGGNHICLPGLVDVHTHLREPGFEYKETIESGTKAAAKGGFTSILCMANTNPVNDNPYVTHFILSQAAKFGHVRVYPVGALSKGLKGEQMAEIGKMKEAGIIAVSDDGMPVMNSYLMRKALDYCKTFDLPIISHAEDANLVGQGVMHEGYHSNCLGLRGIPSESEEILVARDIALARLTGGHVHFAHLSTHQALEHVRRAKEAGLRVTCEATPHHLVFTDQDVASYDPNFKMAPPLRTEKDTAVLKKALSEGIIDCIATDHAPHAPRDKTVLFEFAANGIVGLETAVGVGLGLLEQGVLDWSKFVSVFSANPARIFKLNAGSLGKGMPADFILLDFEKRQMLKSEDLASKSKNSPFLGNKMKGQIVASYMDGKSRFQC